MDILTGCSGFPAPMSIYWRQMKFVEIEQTFNQPPKSDLLMKWRDDAGTRGRFSVLAWQTVTHKPSNLDYRRITSTLSDPRKYGHLQNTEEVAEGWDMTIKSALMLKADIIMLRTPPTFMRLPGAVAIADSFFRRIERRGFKIAWHDEHWEMASFFHFCAGLDLIPVYDPLVHPDLSPPKMAYFRLGGGDGHAAKYSDEDLSHLLDKCRKAKEAAWVSFANGSMWQDSKRFVLMLKEMGLA